MKVQLFFILFVICFISLSFGQTEEGYIHGPGGGLLHPDCHVVLPEGAQLIDQETIILADGTIQIVPPCAHSIPSPQNLTSNLEYRMEKREPNGWNLYSRYFMNAYLDKFNGYWVVPNDPAGGYRGQLLYIFTGLQDASCNCILQPVIWWGISPAGGGNAWFAAVWYVYNNNQNYITSPVVRVYPGWTIDTYMERIIGTGWNCGMTFNGQVLTSGMFPDNLQSNAYAALEVYNTANCDSFPYYSSYTFTMAISQQGVGPVGFNPAFWNLYTPSTSCGQQISCGSNTCTMKYGAPHPCPSANRGSTLPVDNTLNSNGVNALISDGCGYRLFMQGDGNLVLYDIFNRPLWYSSTGGAGPFTLAMQSDGNLVIYGSNGPTWSSETAGKGTYPYNLVMQTDGNLVIYDGAGTPLWASRWFMSY